MAPPPSRLDEGRRDPGPAERAGEGAYVFQGAARTFGMRAMTVLRTFPTCSAE
jgi:hypothetical protein